MEDIDNLFSLLDSVDNDVLREVENSIRVPKIYFRDVNPFQYYSEDFFKKRYSKRPSNTARVPASYGFTILCHWQLSDRMWRFNAHFSINSVQYNRVSFALATQMQSFVKFPVDLRKTKVDFEDLGRIGRGSGLKNVIGAIDCTHIRIVKPRGIVHTEQYRNRKGYFSLNVQVVGGPNLLIHDIVVRWAGSTHDSHIFRNSRFIK